jgi:hypothetical protein
VLGPHEYGVVVCNVSSGVLPEQVQIRTFFESLSPTQYVVQSRALGIWIMADITFLARFWVESLLTEIIFRSALEQDVEVAAASFDTISRDRNHAALSSWIERMLFYRLRKDRAEWHVRCDFSSLLEAIQLSTALG